jgi:hypothetical protein
MAAQRQEQPSSGMPSSGMDIPKRWPLATQPDNRASNYLKDARLVNCYAERDPEDGCYQVEKRYGLSPTPQYSLLGPGQGIFLWTSSDSFGVHTFLIAISDSNAYLDYAFIGAPYIQGMARFQPIASPANSYLVFGSGGGTTSFPGQNPYYISNSAFSTVLQITDPNFPAYTVPGFAFLDGTLYVMTYQGAIYGSKNLNDPTVWDPLNVIQANAMPDNGVVLARQLTYVVAIKSTSTQFFYDAGNATGSPLAPVPGAILNYGCLSADTLAEIDGLLLWVTSNSTNSGQVLLLENLGMRIVSTPGIERQLDLATLGAVFRSFAIKHGGHRLYILTNVTTNVTLVYDIDQHLWYQWTDYLGNYYPIVSQTIDKNGNHLFQHTNGSVYIMDTDFVYPNDYGNVFSVDIYTPNFDAGVDRTKYLSMMRFNGDQTPGSKLNIRSSEDDYQTWTNFRTVSLGSQRPILTDCGSFYRRAYHFNHQSNTAFRIESVDLQMDIGTL